MTTEKSESLGVDQEGSTARTEAPASSLIGALRQGGTGGYATPPTPSDLRDALDGLEGEWEAYADSMPERMVRKKWSKPFDFTKILAARGAIEALFEKQQAEIGARGKLYGDMCEILHDCCQKYKLGLGGENIAELVTEEVSHLRSENGALRARSSLPSLIQALKIADLESSSLTPAEAKSLVPLARHEARMQRDTPEWDTWLNLADKLTRISDKLQ